MAILKLAGMKFDLQSSREFGFYSKEFLTWVEILLAARRKGQPHMTKRVYLVHPETGQVRAGRLVQIR
jgi:hypothetical protein